jgi:hypothetical protein
MVPGGIGHQPTLSILCTLSVSMANHWDVLREGSLTAALGAAIGAAIL